MLAGYGTIALFFLVAVFFALSTLFIPLTLRLIHIVKRKPSPAKYATFECGMDTVGRPWVQFNFRYYAYAIMFVALDVMVVFVYPWAVALRGLGLGGLAAMLVFLAVVVVGYLYAWKKKAMEWK